MTKMKWMWVLTALIGVAKTHAWRTGRATHYGEDHSGQTDGYSIHDGSCQFGSLDPNIGTGWDIAAISDKHPDYQGSCGKCFELKCKPMIFRDNYGDTLDQRSACLDESKSVLVTVVDVCPCYFPRNLYSNKRWCCGDMDHFDISVFAFQKLAPREAGVIALDYREVPCPSYEGFLPTAPENIHVTSKPASHLTATSAVQRVSRSSTSDTTSTQSAIAITLEPVSPEEDTEVEVSVATSQRESKTPVSSTSSATVSGGTGSSIIASITAVAQEESNTKTGGSKEEPQITNPPPVTPAVTAKPVAKPVAKPAPVVKPVSAPKPAPDVRSTPVSDPNPSSTSESVETDTPSGVVSLSIGRWTYRVPENGGQVTRVSRTSSTDTTNTQSVGTSVAASSAGSTSGSFVSSTVSTRGSASGSASSSVSSTRAPVISSSATQTSSGSTTSVSVQSSSTATGANTRSSASSSASTGASSYVSTRSSVTASSGRGGSSTSATQTSTGVNGSGARVSRTSRLDTTSTRVTTGSESSRNDNSGDDSWVPQVG